MLGNRQYRGQRGGGRVIERVPGVVEIQRVRHGAVGVGGVLHGGFKAARDHRSLRVAAAVLHILRDDATQSQRLGGAGEHHGDAVERAGFGHVDGGGGQRVVGDGADFVDQLFGERRHV
jgi:hypothetical protein